MNRTINTVLGPIDEEALVKKEIIEEVPCGTCVTTQYLFNDAVVRQDVEVTVTKAIMSEGITKL